MAISRTSGNSDFAEDSVFGSFLVLPDPRNLGYAARHPWINIIVVAICSMICGAETFVDMQRFGESKHSLLSQALGLDLSSGVPSHDTFGRAFAALDSQAFSELFVRFTQQLHDASNGNIIAIDGKTVRRSFDNASGSGAIHMVNAWSTQAGLALGQVKVDDKSNEITAVPLLLAMLNLKGCIVTADAMSTQKQIASQIKAQGGDYVLAVKDNQHNLRADIEAFFDRATANNWMDANADTISHSYCQTVDADHGRIETRRCWCVDALDELHPDTIKPWAGLASITLIESDRIDKATGQAASTQRRFYITSLSADAYRILNAVREHWAIENNLHWVLDVAFNEDQCRARIGNAAQNLAILRQLTLNLIKKNPAKGSVKSKRLKAGWEDSFLLKILSQT
jgi:predicted transposase YbfD/YdcC